MQMTPKIIFLAQTFFLNSRLIHPARYLTTPMECVVGISNLIHHKRCFRLFLLNLFPLGVGANMYLRVLPLIWQTREENQCPNQEKTLYHSHQREREKKLTLINAVGIFTYLEL